MLDKANLVCKSLCQVKIDYESGGVFSGLYFAPKRKYYSIFNKFGIIQQHSTFKGFSDGKRLVNRSQYFDMLKGEKILLLLRRSCEKKSFNNGILLPTKMRRFNECKNGIICDKCNIQVNENKKFEAILTLFKREAPKEFGHMLPYYKV